MSIIGEKRIHHFTVTAHDTAQFAGKEVHPVCSTFVLAREAEWSGRLFVLDICTPEEEGIGSSLTINHISPALVGETITITATVIYFMAGELRCEYEAKVGERLVAKGQTGQHILPKSKIAQIFERLRT